MSMTLYTCGQKSAGASLGHPCGRAADALHKAGYGPTIEVVPGYRLLPWTRKGKREQIRELTGQENVPVLLLDDGQAIAGSGSIIKWAKAHPASSN